MTNIADILCALPPPEIPTNTEYTLGKDDGKVVINSLEYPALIRTANWELNSTYNSTDIAHNYMANLTSVKLLQQLEFLKNK